jgi:hypothetical protein
MGRAAAIIFASCISSRPAIAPDNQADTKEATYLGAFGSQLAPRALAELTPFARFYVCLEVDKQVMVVQTAVCP